MKTLTDMLWMIAIILIVAISVAGCSTMSGITDNPQTKAAFIQKGLELAAEEDMEVSEEELAIIYDNAVLIVESPPAAAISSVIEGNPDAAEKLKELLEEYLPKE